VIAIIASFTLGSYFNLEYLAVKRPNGINMNLYQLGQPKQLEKILHKATPLAYLAACILFTIGLYYALVASPVDYQQGDTVRIMYVHVPASWFALLIYGFMGVSSACFLVFRTPMAFHMAHAAAPIGAVYTFISLATGSIWGKPMWGAWWVWDARLTSMLILFIMYLGYLLLIESIEDKERSMRVASCLAIIGLINIPIIKFSVDWWHTLHQPASVLRLNGPSIHSSMLVPLLWMASGYLALFVALLCHRLQSLLLSIKVQSAQVKLAWQGRR
jgi:heme exporter protein C